MKFRFSLLVIASFGVSALLFWVTCDAMLTGIVEFGVRRGVVLLAFDRETSPLGFVVLVACYAIFAMIMASVACWRALVLVRFNQSRSQAYIRNEISSLEQLAPSGLKPLWVGLLIAFVVVIIYAAA
jgi:hypothetical protein